MEQSLLKRVKVLTPDQAQQYDGSDSQKPNRYQWITLNLVEPNLGKPNTTGTFFLTGDFTGKRGWTNALPFLDLESLFAENIQTNNLLALTATINVLTIRDRLCSYGYTNVFDVSSNYPAVRITQRGHGPALLVEDSENPDATPFVIDSSGSLLLGSVSAVYGGKFEIFGDNNAKPWVVLKEYGNDNHGSTFALVKTRGDAPDSNTSVIQDDTLGTISFQGTISGFDALSGIETNTNTVAALVYGQVDGDPVPVLSSVPGRLVFATTKNTDFYPTERMRIDSKGSVGIGTTSPNELLTVNGNISSTNLIFGSTLITPASTAALVTTRYLSASLDLLEPNLGVPPYSLAPNTDFWVVSSDYTGVRGWTLSVRPYKYSRELSDLSIIPDRGNNTIVEFYSAFPYPYASTIAGGESNIITIGPSFIGTGTFNTISGGDIFNNSLSASYNFIGNGLLNRVLGSRFSSIVNGEFNTVQENANYSAILGGRNNTIGQGVENTFILGSNITAISSNTTYMDNVKAEFGLFNTLAASVKNFIIEHPSSPGKKLQYSSVESPYIGVQLTGEDCVKNGTCKVKLPNYLKDLIHKNHVHIQLTNLGDYAPLYVHRINLQNNYFVVKSGSFLSKFKSYKFFWLLNGVRKDVDNLIVEV